MQAKGKNNVPATENKFQENSAYIGILLLFLSCAVLQPPFCSQCASWHKVNSLLLPQLMDTLNTETCSHIE
jgi:hypothetical protein